VEGKVQTDGDSFFETWCFPLKTIVLIVIAVRTSIPVRLKLKINEQTTNNLRLSQMTQILFLWQQKQLGVPNAVFWDVTPSDSCMNRCFGGNIPPPSSRQQELAS
jgi:hypothetical protein